MSWCFAAAVATAITIVPPMKKRLFTSEPGANVPPQIAFATTYMRRVVMLFRNAWVARQGRSRFAMMTRFSPA